MHNVPFARPRHGKPPAHGPHRPHGPLATHPRRSPRSGSDGRAKEQLCRPTGIHLARQIGNALLSPADGGGGMPIGHRWPNAVTGIRPAPSYPSRHSRHGRHGRLASVPCAPGPARVTRGLDRRRVPAVRQPRSRERSRPVRPPLRRSRPRSPPRSRLRARPGPRSRLRPITARPPTRTSVNVSTEHPRSQIAGAPRRTPPSAVTPRATSPSPTTTAKRAVPPATDTSTRTNSICGSARSVGISSIKALYASSTDLSLGRPPVLASVQLGPAIRLSRLSGYPGPLLITLPHSPR